MRSIGKALSWRACAVVITASVAWAVTGRLGVAATIGALDSMLKLVAYYLHERFWNRLPTGRTVVAEEPV